MQEGSTDYRTRKAFLEAMRDPARVTLMMQGSIGCIIGQVERADGEVLVSGPRRFHDTTTSYKWSVVVRVSGDRVSVHDPRAQHKTPLVMVELRGDGQHEESAPAP